MKLTCTQSIQSSHARSNREGQRSYHALKYSFEPWKDEEMMTDVTKYEDAIIQGTKLLIEFAMDDSDHQKLTR
jgi:hypothetical protein